MIDKAANASRGVSLDKVTGPNMTDGGDNDPATIAETKEEAGNAMAALSGLDEREQEVVSRVVMQGEKLREVGKLLTVTKERVRQVKEIALERLRESLCE